MMRMFDVHGFILVGGASQRMGRDKSRLMFGSQTSVELIASALRVVTDQVTTVGSSDERVAQIENIPDLRTSWGPLAGIEAALRHAKSTLCLIVACDFPFVTAEMFRHLIARIDDADAVVPLQNDRRPQPLCAIYRRATCLPATDEAIANEQHSPRALLDRVRVVHVPFAELSSLKGSEYFFFNVNTPANYDEAREIFERLSIER